MTESSNIPRAWLAGLVALLMLALGSAASIAGWRWLAASETQATRMALLEQARASHARASGALALASGQLDLLARLLAAGQDAESPVFGELARSILRQHPEIAALGWVARPLASAPAAPAPDGGAAVDPAAGVTVAALPEPEPALPSGTPLQLLIVNPDTPGQALGDAGAWLGRDLEADPKLGPALRKPGESSVVLYDGLQPGQWTVLYPVRAADGALRGHLAAFLASTPLLAQALGEASDGVARRLIDPQDAAGAPYLLYNQGSGAELPPAEAAQLSRREPLPAFGQEWTLEVAALQQFVDQRRSALPRYVLLSGLLLTVLLALALFTVLARTFRIRQLINRRTAELSDAYQKVRDSEMMAMQSEKMSSLGQMVAGVAHEINTPLGFISSNVQLLRELLTRIRALFEQQHKLFNAVPHWARLTPEQRQLWFRAALQQAQALGEVRNEGVFEDIDSLNSESLAGLERLTDLVLTLKNFSRLDRSMVDEVDLNGCIEDTLKIAQNVLKHKAEVEKHLNPLPRIRCNPSQINQVLLNLVTNATHAIDGFGRIDVESQLVGNEIRISLRDNGRGIPPHVLPQIFEPFFTTKAHGEGTGLGLPISRRIIEEHGGRLEVDSHVGVGTVFTIILPATAPTPTYEVQ